MNYVRLCAGLKDYGKLIEVGSDLSNYITDFSKDYYLSTYNYNEEQFKAFKEKGSVRGIREVTTDKLWWDFDDKQYPDNARMDCIELVQRLRKQGLKDNQIEIYFSGNKGFNVLLNIDRELTPEQVREICIDKLGKDLKTLDGSLYDSTQVLRVPGTKHNVTGLYKIPLTFDELYQKDAVAIKAKAVSLDNVSEFSWEYATLPDDVFKTSSQKAKLIIKELKPVNVDWSKKPPHWRNCKWSLLQGNFEAGKRHEALMIIAASCRGLGYDKETTYYMCKSALKKQASRTGQEEFSKDELWKNIIDTSIFRDTWEGGQYTCQKPGWLRDYCQALGDHKCKDHKEEKPVIEITDMAKEFDAFAVNFEKNKINLGLPSLDENVNFLAYTHNGIVAAPGAGKTTLALQFLNTASKDDNGALFLSLDMGQTIVYGKLVQRIHNCSFEDAVKIFTTDKKTRDHVASIISEEFKNVGFNFKAGLTVPDIKDIIRAQQDVTGKEVKLLVTDYLECLAGPYSDQNANQAFISNQMKDLATEFGLCSIILLQTQKHNGTGDISDPILSMRQIKGSSVIEQSGTVLMSLWREGYNPNTVNDDRYLSMAVLKNRLGPLWREDFAFEGQRGVITEMSEEHRAQFNDFKHRKKEMRLQDIADRNGVGDSWS